VSPYIKHMVSSSGSLCNNRAIWVTFSRTPVGKLGILNAYVPNCSKERSRLWEELAVTLDPSHAWLMGGDWNMTEISIDKSSGCGRALT
jgi:hypothetical protein